MHPVLNPSTPEELLLLMATNGHDAYFGEPVTVLEHCLQAAHFAREAGSPEELIAAALLHDVGHLLHQAGEDAAEHGEDTHHEELAGVVLSEHLPDAVTEPIRMHVAAKRFLCASHPAYLQALSPSSLLSLKLQGGPMGEDEMRAFLAGPFAKEAIALRRWDDEAKIPQMVVPGLDAYASLLGRLWRS